MAIDPTNRYWIAPVSYTHLDVYKRQLLRKPKLREMFLQEIMTETKSNRLSAHDLLHKDVPQTLDQCIALVNHSAALGTYSPKIASDLDVEGS